MPATLGYVIATLSELPGVRTSQLEPHPTPSPRGRSATQTPLNTACRRSRPLGRAGEGHLGNSVGVAISRRRYPNANPSPPICRGIIQLSITPTAKRNSYRVAILVGALPRVAGHARNPGLCNRNSYRVARGAYQPIEVPSQPSQRGRSATQTPSNTASMDSRPLGRAGEGLRVAGEGIGGLVSCDTKARDI